MLGALDFVSLVSGDSPAQRSGSPRLIEKPCKGLYEVIILAGRFVTRHAKNHIDSKSRAFLNTNS